MIVQIPAKRAEGLPALIAALVTELNNGGAVLIRCDYCTNDDGPFQYIGITPHIVETPFVWDFRVLTVSHCRDCFR